MQFYVSITCDVHIWNASFYKLQVFLHNFSNHDQNMFFYTSIRSFLNAFVNNPTLHLPRQPVIPICYALNISILYLWLISSWETETGW